MILASSAGLIPHGIWSGDKKLDVAKLSGRAKILTFNCLSKIAMRSYFSTVAVVRVFKTE